MAKYAFFNFATYGQVNPTLAVVQELTARGEDVVYFNTEALRAPIEAAGAKWRPYDAALFQRQNSSKKHTTDDNRRLAMLSIYMIMTSRHAVLSLIERVRAEKPDCLVYSDMFLWARIIGHGLGIPGVALRPTYASDARFRREICKGTGIPSSPPTQLQARLSEELAHLRRTYNLPFSDIASLIRGNEDLTIVFLPLAFQPGGDAFDKRFLFVGPSFQLERDRGKDFPFEKLDSRACLYISLGTIYNNKPEFYETCFRAFENSNRQVILSLGHQLDSSAFKTIPENFITASSVPQLEILQRAAIFISHGGMNSTMESLYFGVPLIIIPHINEQKLTAQRVQELGLGVALDEDAVTAQALKAAVSRITEDPGLKQRVQAMQQSVHAAGGFRKAADALQDFVLK